MAYPLIPSRAAVPDAIAAARRGSLRQGVQVLGLEPLWIRDAVPACSLLQ